MGKTAVVHHIATHLLSFKALVSFFFTPGVHLWTVLATAVWTRHGISDINLVEWLDYPNNLEGGHFVNARHICSYYSTASRGQTLTWVWSLLAMGVVRKLHCKRWNGVHQRLPSLCFQPPAKPSPSTTRTPAGRSRKLCLTTPKSRKFSTAASTR